MNKKNDKVGTFKNKKMVILLICIIFSNMGCAVCQRDGASIGQALSNAFGQGYLQYQLNSVKYQ